MDNKEELQSSCDADGSCLDIANVICLTLVMCFLSESEREATIWEMEEKNLHERHQLMKQQMKDQYFLQRHQLLKKHEKVQMLKATC